MSDFRFTHLHVHSQYSLLDGKASIKELVDAAVADGMHGLALTDHGNMYGIKEFYNYVNKVNGGLDDDKKIKAILGCEMYVAKRSMADREDRSDTGYHLIVLAKNSTGYHNLIKLVSKAMTDGFYYRPRTDKSELEKHREGLIVCSACLGGEIPRLIEAGDIEGAERAALWFKGIFGEDYYLELQRHRTFKENANTDTYEKQQRVNKALVDMGKKLGIKIVATNDVHFTREEDAEAHDRLICISTQKRYHEQRMHYTRQEWFKSTAEMEDVFSDLPDALHNTAEILDKIESYSIDHEPIMPTFEIPESFGTEEEYRQRITEKDLFDEFTQDENGNVVLSQEDAEKKIKRLGGYDKLYRIKFEADYLEKLTMEGALKRYGDPLSDEVKERLKFELYIMKTMGFPGYFLIVQDFINTGREKLGVSIGPGRGSAAGSAAAYCLGITQIDPIKYDLLFERFLNPDRISLPDIDVDFDDDGRYEVLKYVTEKYGEEKVAHIITYGTMATKMAIKDMVKIMDLPRAEGIRIAKLVDARLPEVNGKVPKTNFKNLTLYNKEFAAEVNSPDPVIRDMMKYAGQLEGNVRNTGIHACGVIICRDDITDWVPVSVATDTDGSKVISTQYEGSVIEETGLIKMDFLGLKTLSIIMETLENIRLAKGIDVDIDNIPLDDPATYKLYCEGRTTATFQFESPGMQAHLKALQPSKFEDLIAMNALYRPGPMEYIPEFIKRKHGEHEVTYDIPIMKQYLEETYGITVYQEQVMLLSRLLANFTRGESDMLRKAMGKKQIDKMAKLKVKFMDQGQANGHEAKVLEKIWADWEKFASYAFNKSHATCYSWVAYQTGYLKANYPAEYMAGVMSRNLSDIAKIRKFMDECKAMGLTVKGPDINESRYKFSVSKDGSVRFGLAAVKGVGLNAVNAIVSEREASGPYKDIYDFVERVNLSACNRSAIESLALSGALDCLGIAREAMVEQIADSSYADHLVKYGQRVQQDRDSLQASLFGDLEPLETNKPPIPQFQKWDRFALLERERELVSMYISGHPLDPYYMEVVHGVNTPAADFDDRMQREATVTMAGLVTGLQERVSRKGNAFGVVELEDFSGKTEIRLFGKSFDEFYSKLHPGEPVFIKISFAKSRYNPEAFQFNIDEISPLENYKGRIANELTVFVDINSQDTTLVSALSDLKGEDRKGDFILDLYDTANQQSVKVRSRKQIPINKDLLDILDSLNAKYRIGTSER